MSKDPKAIGAGLIVGGFLVLFIHGLTALHPDQSGPLLALGAVAVGALTIVVARLSV